MRVVISGATGMIGKSITELLQREGHNVTALTRGPAHASAAVSASADSEVVTNGNDDSWCRFIADADVVINLAGEPIGGHRWNDAFKQRLVQSRVATTRRIVDGLRESSASGKKPAALISASAVGYYGGCGDDLVTEERLPGTDFLATLCKEWEGEAERGRSFGVRVVVMRIGLVLAKSGVLEKMLYPLPIPVSPYKLGLGGPLGSGRQWMPWVHIDDVAGLFVFCATNASTMGAYNVASPNPVTNAEFSRRLGKALGRPAVLPVPAFALRLMIGEFSEALLTGQRALPQAALAAGYTFKYPDLDEALRSLI